MRKEGRKEVKLIYTALTNKKKRSDHIATSIKRVSEVTRHTSSTGSDDMHYEACTQNTEAYQALSAGNHVGLHSLP